MNKIILIFLAISISIAIIYIAIHYLDKSSSEQNKNIVDKEFDRLLQESIKEVNESEEVDDYIADQLAKEINDERISKGEEPIPSDELKAGCRKLIDDSSKVSKK